MRFLRICALLVGLPSCATYLALDQPYEEPPATPAAGPYVIGPGDELELEFSRTVIPVDRYRLGIGDTIDVRVHKHPELSLQTTVAPDGTFAYHRVGVIQASGRTVDELQVEIAQRLVAVDALTDPEVTVFLGTTGTRVQRFLDMVLRSPNGSMRELKVNGGGVVSVPGVGALKIGGLSVRDAEAAINQRLADSVPGLQILLNATKDADSNLAVVGEVNRPGTYPLNGEMSLVDSLAMAGWETEYGDLSRVLLMSEAADGVIEARVYDVDDAILHGSSLPQIRVRPADTVLVLRTGVGNSNRAIEQYIRRNNPINVGASYRIQNR